MGGVVQADGQRWRDSQGGCLTVAVEARRVLAYRELERRKCHEHPAYLIDRMVAPDERTGDEFHFDVLTNEERASVGREPRGSSGWYWQRDVLDWWMEHNRSLALKARQLGITWVACGELVESVLVSFTNTSSSLPPP